MNLIGLTLCRNDAWCLNASARAALRWCDSLVIMDHASTDETPDVIDTLQHDFPGRIRRLHDPDPVWHEMTQRQATLELARTYGATHCAIIDADELLTENCVGTIRPMIEALDPGVVLQPPWIMLWRNLDRYRDDASVWSRSYVSMAFRDAPALCWKLRDGGYDHHRRHPFNSECLRAWDHMAGGGIMHLQHASWRRVRAKQAWYRCVEAVRWPEFGAATIEARYAPTTDESGLRLSAVPATWWGPERKFIDVNRTPWQEAEVRKMLTEYGAGKFAGLNLQGVA